MKYILIFINIFLTNLFVTFIYIVFKLFIIIKNVSSVFYFMERNIDIFVLMFHARTPRARSLVVNDPIIQVNNTTTKIIHVNLRRLEEKQANGLYILTELKQYNW